jgi:hypothetical protein
MAFDSIFQGPPVDVAAPGTAQSPTLGVDVTNKALYISAGSGWQELTVPAVAAANSTLVGSGSSGAGAPLTPITLGSGLAITGTTLSATGGGGLTGTLTPSKYPVAATSSSLQDGTIDYGLTVPGTLYITSPGSGANQGIRIDTSTDNFAATDSGITITSGAGIHITNDPISLTNTGLSLVNGGNLPLNIQNNGTGGTTIIDHNGVAIDFIKARTVYSAAGTPIVAAATAGVGARAFVSDATANTFGTAYTSGGTNKVPVWSDGTSWFIG